MAEGSGRYCEQGASCLAGARRELLGRIGPGDGLELVSPRERERAEICMQHGFMRTYPASGT